MAAVDTRFESDGKAVNVSLLHTVVARQVAYVEGFLGITGAGGDSGDEIALTIDGREYQFLVASGLSVSKGQIVYVDVSGFSTHTPDDNDYSTTAGANKIALFKATSDKDSDNVVTGILLPHFAS